MEDFGDYLALIPEDIMQSDAIIFDFDGTIASKANGGDPKHREDTELNYELYPGVDDTFKELIEQNILIIIVTNQSGFTQQKETIFVDLFERYEGKILILVAHKKNNYRKPNIGFIEVINNLNKDSKFNILYYCGDAVGDIETLNNIQIIESYKFKDTDLKFAENAKIDFILPEQIFWFNYHTIVPKKQIVIMMGLPGSGKSTLAKRLESENGFIRYSQDEYKGKLDKVFIKKDMKQNLENGNSIIIDATHYKKENREIWTNFANSLDIEYVILWCIRDGRPFNKKRDKPVNAAVYGRYKNEFTKPEDNYIIVA